MRPGINYKRYKEQSQQAYLQARRLCGGTTQQLGGMAADEKQVLVKFVTKLPAELRVPETPVVSAGAGAGQRDPEPMCHACSMIRLVLSFNCSLCAFTRVFTGCPCYAQALWPVTNHQPHAGPWWVLGQGACMALAAGFRLTTPSARS